MYSGTNAALMSSLLVLILSNALPIEMSLWSRMYRIFSRSILMLELAMAQSWLDVVGIVPHFQERLPVLGSMLLMKQLPLNHLDQLFVSTPMLDLPELLHP